LRAFEQDLAAGLVDGVQVAGDVGDHGLDARHVGQGIVQGLLVVHRLGLQVVGQHEVVVVQVGQQLFGKALFVQQVRHADGATGHLVFVGRADALAGGADLGHARAASRATSRAT
jgi:hypothetical protein